MRSSKTRCLELDQMELSLSTCLLNVEKFSHINNKIL